MKYKHESLGLVTFNGERDMEAAIVPVFLRDGKKFSATTAMIDWDHPLPDYVDSLGQAPPPSAPTRDEVFADAIAHFKANPNDLSPNLRRDLQSLLEGRMTSPPPAPPKVSAEASKAHEQIEAGKKKGA